MSDYIPTSFILIPRSWPAQERTTFAAVFRAGTTPYLQVAQLDNWDFTAESLAPSQLDSIKGSEQETHAIYDVDSRAAAHSVSPFSLSFLHDFKVLQHGSPSGYLRSARLPDTCSRQNLSDE